jgi:hypothetical protein
MSKVSPKSPEFWLAVSRVLIALTFMFFVWVLSSIARDLHEFRQSTTCTFTLFSEVNSIKDQMDLIFYEAIAASNAEDDELVSRHVQRLQTLRVELADASERREQAAEICD